ncbi:MAG TPA: hypothetical protein VFS43_46815 [Polyangiaceae bacterium]|nr:hypothetical protein [Polyangiaceae bacterium]
MPALLAPFVGFSLGVFFSWASADEVARGLGPLVISRPFAIVALFALLGFAPALGYFLTFAADWSLAYLVDTRRVPSALLLLLALGSGASVLAGFALGARQVRARRPVSLLPLMTVPLAAAAVLLGAFARNLALFGSYVQVTRQLDAEPIAGSSLGYAVLWVNACLLASVLWTAHELRRGAGRRGA